MTKRTSFAVIDKHGKTIENTSRVQYKSGCVEYKGKMYSLIQGRVIKKAQYVIILGNELSKGDMLFIKKQGRKEIPIKDYREFQQKAIKQLGIPSYGDEFFQLSSYKFDQIKNESDWRLPLKYETQNAGEAFKAYHGVKHAHQGVEIEYKPSSIIISSKGLCHYVLLSYAHGDLEHKRWVRKNCPKAKSYYK